MNKFAIYTAIVGGYDNILQPLVTDERFDYILFTNDIAEKQIGVWQVRPIPYHNDIQTKIARRVKTHPEELLPEYEFTVWMDGSFQIKSHLFYEQIIDYSRKGTEIAVRKHPARDCAYDEATICALWRLEYEEIILNWIKFLQKNKFPHNYGLYETGIIFRHNSTLIKQLDQLWWTCIEKYSKRDQLSFTLCLFKTGLHCTPLFEDDSDEQTSRYYNLFRIHKNEKGKRLETNSRNYPFLFWYFTLHPEKEKDTFLPEIRRKYEVICRTPNPKMTTRILRKYYKEKIKRYGRKNKDFDMEGYSQWVDQLKNAKDHFVPYTDKPFERQPGDPKVYAFYLTQFHAVPENDRAHGKGFTEWTNVASATPQFVGHYQPKIPYDLGFYNLLMPGVMERQVEIAKTYGIYGFCFYYYWFSGKKLLEKPLEYFLHSDIDFHYHLCWATENWSKRWDGGENELIVEQKLQDDDADKFFSDLLPYISDPRYEQIAGKPVLIAYRPAVFDSEKYKVFSRKINQLAQEHGFKGIYLLCTNALDNCVPQEYSCDGLVEFPPHGINVDNYLLQKPKLSAQCDFSIVDMESYIRDGNHIQKHEKKYPIYKTCFPEWDNTPRKLYNNGYCFLMQPEGFSRWLADNIHWTREHHGDDEQIVYINAWNEWGEGAILEPTIRYGYRNLEVLKQTLESCRK